MDNVASMGCAGVCLGWLGSVLGVNGSVVVCWGWLGSVLGVNWSVGVCWGIVLYLDFKYIHTRIIGVRRACGHDVVLVV